MPRPEKTQAVDDYKQLLQEAKTVFVTDYTGLNVEEITKLRKNLRDNSVRYLVAKNTLLRIAAKDTDFDRSQAFVMPGVLADGTPNDIQITAV